jgi:hypothetical protein
MLDFSPRAGTTLRRGVALREAAVTTERDCGPDSFDHTERPGSREKSVRAGQRTSDGESQHVPSVAMLQRIHRHHEGENEDAVGGDHEGSSSDAPTGRLKNDLTDVRMSTWPMTAAIFSA